jgi:hypothetical protein
VTKGHLVKDENDPLVEMAFPNLEVLKHDFGAMIARSVVSELGE